MIDLNQLRAFYQTAKYQNCTVAAERLFNTQPGVTAQAFLDILEELSSEGTPLQSFSSLVARMAVSIG